MKCKIENIAVMLGKRSYPIYIGIGILNKFPKIVSKHNLSKNITIVSDRNVATLYLKQFSDKLRSEGINVHEIVVPEGEKQKSLTRANEIFTKLLNAGLTRNTTLIAFGGGVVGDLTGFVASTFRRGVQLVQVPTTLLGQVESSLGGKTAVNHPFGKNAIGTYYQPKFVFSDVQLLSTLPRREIYCGLGEIVKYAMLDEGIFHFLDKHLEKIFKYNLNVMRELIILCNTYKAGLIAKDEKELNPKGGRKVLNLGHTIGHALENLSHYKLHHGEAVLIGLRWELILAKEARIIRESDFEKFNTLLMRIPFKPNINFLKQGSLFNVLLSKSGKTNFVLPKKIGEVCIADQLRPALIKSILKKILNEQ